MPFCKYCGSAHDADAAFCTECGKPITHKAVPAEEMNAEVSVAVEPSEIIRVEDADRPYIPGDPITPEMQARIDAYQERVTKYTISLTVFKQLWRDRSDLFGEEEWKKAEAALAEKYGLPDNSIFRQRAFPDFEAERNATTTVQHRKNGSYTKRNAEYWSQFDKTEDDT